MEKSQYDYLEEERKKLWDVVETLRTSCDRVGQDIVLVKENVKKKTSDYEAEAKNSARQAASNKTKTSNILIETKEHKKNSKSSLVT